MHLRCPKLDKSANDRLHIMNHGATPLGNTLTIPTKMLPTGSNFDPALPVKVAATEISRRTQTCKSKRINKSAILTWSTTSPHFCRLTRFLRGMPPAEHGRSGDIYEFMISHPCHGSHLFSPVESNNPNKQSGDYQRAFDCRDCVHAPLQRGFQQGKIRWALYAAHLSNLQHLTA